MCSKTLLKLIIYLAIPSCTTGYCQEKRDYPYVLNRPAQKGAPFYLEARYSHNCLRDLRILTRDQFLEPVITKEDPFYSYNVSLVYKRIGLEVGKYFKKYPVGGIYVKGMSEHHTSIKGYDETKACIKNYHKNYFRISLLPMQREFYDFGINLNIDYENSSYNLLEFTKYRTKIYKEDRIRPFYFQQYVN